MHQIQKLNKYKKEIRAGILLLIIGVILYFPILTQRLANPDAVLIGRIFEMTEWSTLITGVLLLTAPHLMDLMTCYYCSSVYMLSLFLCAALSAYMFIGSESKKGWSFLFGCLGIFISLSIYQAYLFVAVTLCLLKTINVLLRQWKDRTIKESCIRLFGAAAGCACSSVVYIIVAK